MLSSFSFLSNADFNTFDQQYQYAQKYVHYEKTDIDVNADVLKRRVLSILEFADVKMHELSFNDISCYISAKYIAYCKHNFSLMPNHEHKFDKQIHLNYFSRYQIATIGLNNLQQMLCNKSQKFSVRCNIIGCYHKDDPFLKLIHYKPSIKMQQFDENKIVDMLFRCHLHINVPKTDRADVFQNFYVISNLQNCYLMTCKVLPQLRLNISDSKLYINSSEFSSSYYDSQLDTLLIPVIGTYYSVIVNTSFTPYQTLISYLFCLDVATLAYVVQHHKSDTICKFQYYDIFINDNEISNTADMYNNFTEKLICVR